jgi:ribosome-associated protein
MRPMLEVSDSIQIDEAELEETFIRSPGPGGQHVNKTATAVQLRFDVENSASLSDVIRVRLKSLAGRRLTKEGVLVIESSRHRSQEKNRQDARNRLVELIRQAARPTRKRKLTRPPSGAVERRLQSKRRRAMVKRNRRLPPQFD